MVVFFQVGMLMISCVLPTGDASCFFSPLTSDYHNAYNVANKGYVNDGLSDVDWYSCGNIRSPTVVIDSNAYFVHLDGDVGNNISNIYNSYGNILYSK